ACRRSPSPCSTPESWPDPRSARMPATNTPRLQPNCWTPPGTSPAWLPTTGSSCPTWPCSTPCATPRSPRWCWGCAPASRCGRTSPACSARCPRSCGSRSMAESTGRTSGEADPAGRALPVTDAHLHLWDLGGGGYAWLSGAPERLRHDARWEDTADVHAELGVRRVILVQADDTLADTCALQERAAGIEAEPSPVDRADVVAWLPLDDPDATVEILQDPARSRRVVGARHLVHDDPDPGFLDRPTVRASLSVLAERGLALDVPDAFPRHLAQAARVAEDVEDLTVMLDHLGKPPLGNEPGMDRWEGQLRAFAHGPAPSRSCPGCPPAAPGTRTRQSCGGPSSSPWRPSGRTACCSAATGPSPRGPSIWDRARTRCSRCSPSCPTASGRRSCPGPPSASTADRARSPDARGSDPVGALLDPALHPTDVCGGMHPSQVTAPGAQGIQDPSVLGQGPVHGM